MLKALEEKLKKMGGPAIRNKIEEKWNLSPEMCDNGRSSLTSSQFENSVKISDNYNDKIDGIFEISDKTNSGP